jgi:hypothetical protein
MPSFPKAVEIVMKLFGGMRFPFSVITAGLPSARLGVLSVSGAAFHFSLQFPSSTVLAISVPIVDSTHPHSLKPGQAIHTNPP